MGSIIVMQKPYDDSLSSRAFHPLFKQWFFGKFKQFSDPQKYAMYNIHARINTLLSSPTGSGKTLAAFGSILNELIDLHEKNVLEDKIYCVYISPLRALSHDIEKNLNEPLVEMEKIAGKPLGIRIGVRTGDTTASEKSKMLKSPPHILITTPESLAIALSSSKFVEHLKNVEWMIVDEIHSLAESKRGVHLSLSMERLQNFSPGLTRIGLSATVAPLEEVAKYLVGHERDCHVVDVQFTKQLDLQVMSPVEDLIETTHEEMHHKLYELIDKLVQEHKTTLVFTNTRAATERVVHHLRDKFPSNYTETIEEQKEDHEDTAALSSEETRSPSSSQNFLDENSDVRRRGLSLTGRQHLMQKTEKILKMVTEKKQELGSTIGAHHGSLSKRHRLEIEKKLKEGKLKVVVCSTSLELGIDIGYIDLVICLGSPKSVARTLQRIGRSGHQLHATTKGRILVMNRDDLVECAVILKSALEKKIDRIHIPKNSLDVLAQQVSGLALEQVWEENDLFALVKKSYCYQHLKKEDFDAILSYLAGEYTSLEERHIYAKIWRNEGKLGKRGKMARVLYMTNIGTIPDESFITVKIGDQTIGKLDEAFLERLKPGDVFLLGGNTYVFKFSRGMVAQVGASTQRPPTVPSWISETLPLSYDLALEIGKFRFYLFEKFLGNAKKEDILSFIHSYLYVDEKAALAIYEYFRQQYLYCNQIPNHKRILIEYCHEEEETKIIFHALFGRRVNDCLSRAVAFVISKTEQKDVEIGISDNGFFLSYPKRVNALKAFSLLQPEKLSLVLEAALERSEVYKRRFRHCATRALMILRNYKGHQKTAGRQQVSSMILMKALQRISNTFFLLKEAKREVLEDLMDIEHTKEILEAIKEKKIKIEEIETQIPSPFALSLALQGRMDILKMEERQEFLKRMHQMIQAKISLKK